MIAGRVVQVGLATTWAGLVFALKVLVGRGASRAERRALFGKAMSDLLTRLGPTYVKFGQILATRRDIVPPEIVEQLRVLQDAVAPMRFDAITKGRTDEFGFDVGAAFRTIEQHPFASGSVACVYRGKTWDGLDVAIKIRRPNAPRIVARDTAVLRLLARYLQGLRRLRHVPVLQIMDAICVSLEDQLDFKRELDMMRRIHHAMEPEPAIRLPGPIDEFCGSAVITMEFLDEFHPEPHGRSDGSDRLHEAAQTGLRALYRMIFVDGLVHCDLHGGNIQLLPDGQVAIVDFGLVAHMRKEDRLGFARFFYLVAAGNGPDCASAVIDTAQSVPAELDRIAFDAEIIDLVETVGRTPTDFSVSGFVTRLFDIQRRHGIVGTPQFASAILSLLVYEGIVRQWLPELDFQAEAQRYIFLGSFSQQECMESQGLNLA